MLAPGARLAHWNHHTTQLQQEPYIQTQTMTAVKERHTYDPWKSPDLHMATVLGDKQTLLLSLLLTIVIMDPGSKLASNVCLIFLHIRFFLYVSIHSISISFLLLSQFCTFCLIKMSDPTGPGAHVRFLLPVRNAPAGPFLWNLHVGVVAVFRPPWGLEPLLIFFEYCSLKVCKVFVGILMEIVLNL